MQSLRLAILSNSPGPNQTQYFDALAKIADIDVSVYYCARKNIKWQGTDTNRFNHNAHFLINLNPWPESRGYLHCNPAALYIVTSKRYDLVMIQGYAYPTALATIITCLISRKPFVFWGEMINRNPRIITKPLKHFFIWPFMRKAQAIMTMGPSGVRSFKKIGVDSDRIYEVPYACDLRNYLKVPGNIRRSRRRRKKILVISQLIKRKRVDIALKAFLCLADRYQDWDMVICGDGPCRSELERMVLSQHKSRVVFRGFVPKDQQTAIYADADIFLLTSSQDGWGMVVVEAMASGLPVISTYAVESAKVLIDNRACGLLIEPNSVRETIEALEILINNEAMRIHMGASAREKAKEHDVVKVAQYSADILLKTFQYSLQS